MKDISQKLLTKDSAEKTLEAGAHHFWDSMTRGWSCKNPEILCHLQEMREQQFSKMDAMRRLVAGQETKGSAAGGMHPFGPCPRDRDLGGDEQPDGVVEEKVPRRDGKLESERGEVAAGC